MFSQTFGEFSTKQLDELARVNYGIEIEIEDK